LKSTAPVCIAAINVTAENTKLRPDIVSGMGMLVAELLTNSFKHAYADGQHGIVAVDFRQAPDGWFLEVLDEGRGLPAGLDIDQSKGVGMQVVKAFVRRLAKLDISSRPGRTMFRINNVQG
jgi:two-component sensor histidine kinase